MNKALLVSALASHAAHAIKNYISPREEPEMTTLSKEDVVQLIEELGAGSNWLSGKYNVYSYNRQPKIAAMFLKAFAEQGLLELIAELRKPHDWKIEGFGHFKDAKTSPSDAPFRAADVLEHFATVSRADLVAENERLKALSVTNIMVDVVPGDGSGLEVYAKSVDEVVNILSELGEKVEDLESVRAQLTVTRTALVAAEADNERLRKFVDEVAKQTPEKPDYWSSCSQCEHNSSEADDLITQPRDDSALCEMIAEVYEECANVCESRAIPSIDSDDEWDDGFVFSAKGCATAIRALAEKAKRNYG